MPSDPRKSDKSRKFDKRSSRKSDKRKHWKRSKAELDIEQAKKKMLKVVANEIKTRLQPQYEQGLISRERFKAVIEASSRACAKNILEAKDGSAICGVCSQALPQCPCLSEALKEDLLGVASPRGPPQKICKACTKPLPATDFNTTNADTCQRCSAELRRGSKKNDPRRKSGHRTPSPSYSMSSVHEPFSPPRAGTFKPEFPLVDELFGSEDEVYVGLQKNEVMRPWSVKTAREYCYMHYHLLRADFISQLRQEVDLWLRRGEYAVRDGDGDESSIRAAQLCTDVSVMMVNVCPNGAPVVTVRFTSAETKDWMAGNLVMLVDKTALHRPDPIFGTVQNAPKDCSELGLYFDPEQLARLSFRKTYFMLESPAYWGAYQPVLEWLRDGEISKIPIANALLSGTNKLPPPYLNSAPISLSPLYSDSWKVKGQKFDAAGVWPHEIDDLQAPTMILDESQTVAMRSILTSSVALVQGPPGTGKSFLGVKAAQIFHKALFERGHLEPILVVCLTNHALDQFLEDMLPTMPQLLRFGGMSKSTNPALLTRVINKMPLPAAKKNWLQTSKSALIKAGELLHPLWEVYALEESATLWLIARALHPSISVQLSKGEEDAPIEDLVKNLHTWLAMKDQWEKGSVKGEMSDAMVAAKTKVEKMDGLVIEKLREVSRESIERLLSDDVWSMPLEKRWLALKTCAAAMQKAIEQELKDGISGLRAQHQKYLRAKIGCDVSLCMGQAPLVGMTANYAARNRELLQRLQPRVCIVEEAGELLESQLLACLSSPALEHLVLIGDHQQLRPKVSDFTLEKQFALDVSLFERLLNKGSAAASLALQLRMRPEICDLVRPFYQQLLDHPRVISHPPCSGTRHNVFFVNHTAQEDPVFRTSSKKNTHEAKLVVKLAEYFVLVKRYAPSEITILTPYLGQKRLVKEMLAEADESRDDGKILAPPLGPSKGMPEPGQKDADKDDAGDGGVPEHVVVATIDDYQGEENKIVLLTLVRSNPEGKLGFVAIENRIIVALSRAQHGMFIVGNGDQLRNGSPLWARTIEQLEVQHKYGKDLHLTHREFPEKGLLVNCGEDVEKILRKDYKTLQTVGSFHANGGGGQPRRPRPVQITNSNEGSARKKSRKIPRTAQAKSPQFGWGGKSLGVKSPTVGNPGSRKSPRLIKSPEVPYSPHFK